MKILLNIFTTDISEQESIELTELFNADGYMVLNFNSPQQDYYLDFIDTLLNYLLTEHNIDPYNSKIVIQSNIFNLLLSWYRLYNDVIDEFVLVDDYISVYHPSDSEEQLFVNRLSSLVALKNDKCHERFYYRYSKIIKLEVLKPFIESYNYNLLKPFEEFKLNAFYKKEKFKKEYKLNKWSFNRDTDTAHIDQVIDLTQQEETFQHEIRIGENIISSGYFFVFQYILNLNIHDSEKTQATLTLNQQTPDKHKQKITEYTLDYLAKTERLLSFKHVINLYSFLVMLNVDKSAMKRMLKYIKNDTNHFDDHYAPFTNALFYITKANQEEYEDYFLDRQVIMRKLKEYYSSKIILGNCERLENHLVIVTGQLLSYNHAPTKITIDYANNLVKYNPKLKVKLVVEDMFNYSPNELFFVFPFASANSRTLKGEHRKLLDPSIEVYYSECSLPRMERLQKDIDAIIEHQPRWIFKYAAPDSLAVVQLFNYYPILSLSAGGAEYSEFVHIATGGRSAEEVLDERKSKGLSNDGYTYKQHITGLEFPSSKNSISRAVYDLSIEDFVIISVGNRLDIELDKTFVTGMKKVLQKDKKVKWLVVGIKQHGLINTLLKEVISQVKFIPYAQDLMDVYSICDMYANPFRQGGGISVAMAMFAKLPVANLKGSNDANIYIPKGKAVAMDDYFSYIEMLCNSNELCKTEGAIYQKEIIEKYTLEKAISNVYCLLNETELIFQRSLN